MSATAGTADETALVSRLKAGDGTAFEQVVRAHSGNLLALARRFLRNEEDARDVLQDSLLSAFRSIGKFEGGCALGTWLHRITVNAALMKLRSKRRRPERRIEEMLPRFSEDGHYLEPPAKWERCDVALERQETRAAVRDAIEMMPERFRTVLLMRDIAGMDNAAVAEALGITPNAARVRLHRAHQALRTLIDEHFRGLTT